MDVISQDHDLFRRDTPIKEIPRHSYLARIDTWERESISKIQAIAETARADLRQLLDRTKNDLKTSVEKMTNELQSCQQSDDYTENDLKRWAEQLKDFRRRLETPSTIAVGNDDDAQAVIRFLKVSEKQQHQHPVRSSIPSAVRTAEHRIHSIKESIPSSHERFADIDGKAALTDDGLLVTGSLASILSQPIIYGVNRYTTGRHQIRFRIEKMGEQRLFFGIIRSLENISRSGQAQNGNASLYGWWDLNEAIVNGKAQSTKYRNIVITGDELTLLVDCESKQIQLQHQRTKRLAQLTIDLDKCPFPWKIVVRLQSAGDCVRILQWSRYRNISTLGFLLCISIEINKSVLVMFMIEFGAKRMIQLIQ